MALTYSLTESDTGYTGMHEFGLLEKMPTIFCVLDSTEVMYEAAHVCVVW